RLLWSGVGALVESRRALAQHQQAARHLEWIPAGFCLRIWMDAVHRSYSYDGAGFGGGERYDFARRGAAGGVFGGAGGAVSADRAGDRTIPEVLPTLSKAFACCRIVQRSAAAVCRRAGVREPADLAGRQTELPEWHGALAGTFADRQVALALLHASVFLGNIC